MWHLCGTVKMGRVGEKDTRVDKDFRISGLQGLRVVDLSVTPLMPTWASLWYLSYLKC